MEISIVFQSIINITILILIGAIFSKPFPLREESRKMFIALIVNIAMPCMILSSIFKVDWHEGILQSIAIVFWLFPD